MNPKDHGYSYTKGNCKLHLFHNIRNDPNVINQVHKYLPHWTPSARNTCYTICIQDVMSRVGIYEVENILNLYTIIPRYAQNSNDVKAHLPGILEIIHQLIKTNSNPQIANEIRYKIAFYRPPAITIDHNNWVGGWRFTKKTTTTICSIDIGGECEEYVARWLFNDDYSIRPKNQFHTPLDTWLELKASNSAKMEMS